VTLWRGSYLGVKQFSFGNLLFVHMGSQIQVIVHFWSQLSMSHDSHTFLMLPAAFIPDVDKSDAGNVELQEKG